MNGDRSTCEVWDNTHLPTNLIGVPQNILHFVNRAQERAEPTTFLPRSLYYLPLQFDHPNRFSTAPVSTSTR